MNTFYSLKHSRIQLYSRIGFRGEGTNIAKDDKPIRLNRNLIQRMISSKTTQKPASTALYSVRSRFIQDQQAWTRNTWQLRLIQVRLFGNTWSMCRIELKIWTCNIRITNKDKADSNQFKLGKGVLHEFKHKVKLKATHGYLMNLLDLAKSNRANN
jgi:hypothetical protein